MPQLPTKISSQQISIPEIELIEEIGHGAQTTVYRGIRFDDTVAVKIRRHISEKERKNDVQRFRREAALLACIRHPALASIYEVGEIDRRPLTHFS